MKKLLLLLAIVISVQSCQPKLMTGRQHVQYTQAKGNYSIEKWKKEYKRLNAKKEKDKPTVTIQRH
jgi:DNA/RNA-binding domain of Phe-tRNA-synthetase-like protein